MYHIKEDKRSQASARLVGEAMMELLETHAFDDISISDIQRQSTVGRATFYRLFDNTVDVLSWLCNQTFDQIVMEHPDLSGGMEQAMTHFIGIWMEQEALLQAIIRSGHMEVLYAMFFRRMEETGEMLFSGMPIDPKKADYLVSISTTALIGGLSAWIKHGKTETAEEVFANVRDVVKVFYQMTAQ